MIFETTFHNMNSGTQAIDRTFKIVSLLAKAGGPLQLGEVVQATKLNKTTAYRFLRALEHHNFVKRDPRSHAYSLGFGVLELAAALLRRVDVRTAALPQMEELHVVTKETIALSVIVGDTRVCIEQLECTHPMRAVLDVGVPLPLAAGAAGKAILAFLPRERRDVTLRRLELAAYTTNTIVDRKKLQADLQRIAAVGFSQSDGERISGMAGVAAPIFGRDGSPIASLAVVGVAARFTSEVRDATGPVVRSATQQISKLLGFTSGNIIA